jgi:hypothetical protein
VTCMIHNPLWMYYTESTQPLTCSCAGVFVPSCRPSQDFTAHKWSRSSGVWKPVVLRVTAFGLEALSPQSGTRLQQHRKTPCSCRILLTCGKHTGVLQCFK